MRYPQLFWDGGAWKVDGRAQALVGLGLATPLLTHPFHTVNFHQPCNKKL